MSYDDWKLMTPEEDRERFRSRRRRDPDDEPEEQECPSCGEIEPLDHDYTLCAACLKELLMADDGPPEDDEPDDPDATPIVTGDDPDDSISDDPAHYRELGGEGG